LATFAGHQQIGFAHTDPAGLVFYPRYLDMFNNLIEDWFAQDIKQDIRTLVQDRRIGIPAVRIECDFVRPTRLGDLLQLQLSVEAMSESSVSLIIHGSVDGTPRVTALVTLVFVSLDSFEPVAAPPDIRKKIERYLP
jgi:4-hydroxybenzoyl-CoA thioesterase